MDRRGETEKATERQRDRTEFRVSQSGWSRGAVWSWSSYSAAAEVGESGVVSESRGGVVGAVGVVVVVVVVVVAVAVSRSHSRSAAWLGVVSSGVVVVVVVVILVLVVVVVGGGVRITISWR
jgi:hypothetical protein